MATLYEILGEVQTALDAAIDPETGEILDEQAFEEFNLLSLAKDEKVENIGCFIKNLLSEAAALKTEKMNLAKRQQQCENRAEWLKKYLAYCLNGEKYSSARVAISYRKSTSVVIDDSVDLATLPEQYVKTTYEARKTELKDALKNGEIIDGITLEEKNNITIK